jgi:tetratricopeptide (TPR) repeat protein
MWFRDGRLKVSRRVSVAAAAVLCAGMAARAELPEFLQHVVGASTLEAALFRVMELPGVKAVYPRPPKEAQGELQKLLAQDAQQAEVYRLKAMEDEQALDFGAAEADWKGYVAHAKTPVGAKLELAAFYQRRLQGADEVRVLMEVGAAPAASDEAFVAADKQRSWDAFARVLAVAKDDAMDAGVSRRAYEAWVTRYPKESAVFVKYFDWLLEAKQYDEAAGLVARYRTAFPADAVFPVKATALVELKRGSVAKALAVYDASFQPLWPQELEDSYYGLLAQTHEQRSFVGAARARLEKNPEDFDAVCRLYFYEKQAGRGDAAQAAVDRFRLGKDSRKSAWSAQELYTLMMLMERSAAWPEAARYAFALYSLPGSATVEGRGAQETGLAAMVEILLKAPEQPLMLGAHNLSMYSDIATLDQGPGYWNGVLSLWMNSSSPASEFHDEEVKAQPYFHRAKAAQLLQMLDAKFPQAEARAGLHARLIAVYAEYGESALVVKAGEAYLQQFPQGAERVAVAMQMADAYAREKDTKDEFALYDRVLTELGAKTQGMPLTAAAASTVAAGDGAAAADAAASGASDKADGDTASAKTAAFDVTAAPSVVHVDGAQEYSQVLERYLGRLVMTGQMQGALTVLRKELDRNPNDPLLYERLAQFLEQNKLDAQQEEVYKTAMARFADKSWYDKLARFYLREKRDEAYADLTRQVTRTFEGTELEDYFHSAGGVGPRMAVQLNLYAMQRFPHDLVFVRNLLELYEVNPTRDPAARLALLRAHWWEADDLQTEFFATLSRTGGLAAELQQLQGADAQKNPAAGRELAEVEIWRSHFEESAAPLEELAAMYPADVEVGESAASVFRSLAYYDASQTAKAVAVEKNLLAANPGDLDRLATIGDTYADAGAAGTQGHEDLAAAEPYWRRMPEVTPGSKDGYLQAATVFWDYFEFDKALEEIQAARVTFHEPALFGYEAGAICEGKRDSRCAVREYTAAAIAGNDDARERLLTLAARDNFAALVDEAAKGAGDSDAAMMLREDLLHAQGKDAAVGPLLEAELGRATTLDEVLAIADRAKDKNLTLVYEKALAREVALAVDPVQKIELQYTLARSQESRKDVQDAARVMAAVYAANPKILGVVRATVDFDWRTDARKQAIAVLLEASKGARPDLGRQFALEAAVKANEAGEYAQAREIMGPLLEGAPFDPQVIAAMADSYARAGDDVGLRDFYSGRLVAVRTATMTADAKKQTTLLLRRGLIPALTRMRDYNGATEQYIAMLSAYPEDAGLMQEASLYALRWQQKDVLVGFVARTVQESPKDSRFAAMLAGMQTIFEDYPAAIEAWAHAVSVRADKQEWFAAKADLELRLGRLDDACVDDERLYVLSYKDPQWMVAVAQVRAQQGRRQDAVAALQKAWIAGHAATAADDFKVANQLLQWGMLAESRGFAEQGLKLAGGDLLVADADGAVTYMQVMARLREADAAVNVLDKALAAAAVSSSSPSVIAEQVEKKGLASVTDAQWRQKLVEQRITIAQGSYGRAMDAMASAVATYYTPEEKSHFATLLQKEPAHTDLARVAGLAGLKDVQAALLRERLMQSKSKIAPEFHAWVALQRGRMMFAEIAHTMESYASVVVPRLGRGTAQKEAVTAYRELGDEADELRVTVALGRAGRDESLRERMFELMLRRDPAQLVRLAGRNDSTGDEAANYALAHAEEPIALQALAARGAAMEPVWQTSYRALAGLYFGDRGVETDAAFQKTLADRTVGERVAHPVDKNVALAGDPWFYYGMRYGVFRLEGGPGDAEDYAASELEQAAGFNNYVNLARMYADAGKVDAALVEYRHALELEPGSASVHDAMAVLLWKAGRHDEAVKQWQIALGLLRQQIDLQAVPNEFFTTTELVARHAKQYGAVPQLRADLGDVVKTYLAKNGTYRSNELLLAAFDAAGKPEDGVAWVMELSAVSKEQAQILGDLQNVPWVPRSLQPRLYLKRLELERAGEDKSSGAYAADEVVSLESALVVLYTDLKEDAEAKAMLAQIPEEKRQSSGLIGARVALGARDGSLKALLDAYDALPDSAQPPVNSLRAAADRLASDGDAANARVVLEYLFERATLRHQLTATDYLGLADARIKTGDLPGALDLLRRMTLLASDSTSSASRYANDDLAAGLLEKAGHPGEAIAFLKTLAAGQPWNAEYGVRLAEAQLKAGQDVAAARASLVAIGTSAGTPYELRARAAIDLRGGDVASLGSAELNLLAAKTVAAEKARQPYFAKARMAAAGLLGAKALGDAKQQEALLREALAIEADGSDSDAIRVGIFHAEAGLGQNALAIASIKPLIAQFEGTASSTAEQDTDAAEEETPDADATQPAAVVQDVGERAELLVAISDVSWRMGDAADAIQYLQSAVRLTPKSDQSGTWQQKLAQRQAVVRRARTNAARRPVVHGAVDQSVAVRPRLVAAKEAR